MSAPVVLLEPRLADRHGHYLSQVCSLTRALRRLDRSVLVLGARSANAAVYAAVAEAGATFVAACSAVESERLRARAAVWPAFATALVTDLAAVRGRVPPGAVAVVPSAELDVLLGLAMAMKAGVWRPRTVAQMFYWDRRAGDSRFPRVEAALSRATRRATRSAMPNGLRVVGHSKPIADELARVLGQEVDHTPLAVTWEPSALGPRATERPTVAFVGGLRDEKGFAQLSDAIERVTGDVRWRAQAAPHALADEARRVEFVSRVTGAGGVCHEAPLDHADYAALLRAADICVCPYEPSRYAMRTSGVVIEAIGLGATPVVPGGTWLAAFVRDAGVGEIYEPYTAAALADAIDRVVAQWGERRAAAADVAPAVREEHAPEAVAKRLLELAAG